MKSVDISAMVLDEYTVTSIVVSMCFMQLQLFDGTSFISALELNNNVIRFNCRLNFLQANAIYFCEVMRLSLLNSNYFPVYT